MNLHNIQVQSHISLLGRGKLMTALCRERAATIWGGVPR